MKFRYFTQAYAASLMVAILLPTSAAYAESDFRGFKPGITIDDFRSIAMSESLNLREPRASRSRGLPVTEISAWKRDGFTVLARFAQGADRAYLIDVTDKIGGSLLKEMTGSASSMAGVKAMTERWKEDGFKLFWSSGNISGNQPQNLTITDPNLEPKP